MLNGEDGSDKKIGGYDKWEVRSAATTLTEAHEIRTKKPKKFLGVVLNEMLRQADEKEQAAKETRIAAKLQKQEKSNAQKKSS